MRLLLDTHAILWWLADAPMTPSARSEIAATEATVMVSAVTVWEIAIKQASGKLRFDGPLVETMLGAGFDPLEISLAHAERVGGLPLHHRDPFDRMLIAQAQIDGLTLVSRDPAFEQYDVNLLRC